MIIHQISSESYVIFAVGPLKVNHMIVDLAMKNRTPLKIAVLAGWPAFEVAALLNCRGASSRPVTAHEFAPAIDADLVQKRALVLLRPARLACRNLRLPSLLAPFALFFFPSGRKALGTSARPAEVALVLQEQIEQLFRPARWPGRAIELQSFGAGNRVFETKAEKPHEREAIAPLIFRPIAGTSACNASPLKTAISSQRLRSAKFLRAAFSLGWKDSHSTIAAIATSGSPFSSRLS
ncbi:MAG: hypothetical protein CR217_03615 [Beijerinckiaceae bacterium]|nr:MAG: hypothetical protein CR217_03615 [Beijerinckiaceae bacterium]